MRTAILAFSLAIPSTALAGKKPPSAPPPSDVLDSLTRPSTGVFGRVSSADLTTDAVLGAGESLVLGEVAGPAIIDRLWIAVEGADTFGRDLVLRIAWDGALGPSVEAPLADLFAVGPGALQDLQSVPMSAQSDGRSLTSLWKMPFARSARVTLDNEGVHGTRLLAWEIDYRSVPALPPGTLYFHAVYAQASPGDDGKPLLALRASGRGQFVGLAAAFQNGEPGSWGSGSIHFQVDGDSKRGPGAEPLVRYFGNLFGVAVTNGPWQGCTLDEGDRTKARTAVYRFHALDPVPFARAIEVTLDHGPDNDRSDRLGTVAYWYQDRPAAPWAALAAARDRRWPAPSDAELALWKRADELNRNVLDAYRRNDLAAALSILEELIVLEPDNAFASYNLACLYALHGKADAALHMLEQALTLGFDELSFARHDPDLQSLHSHQRFRALVGLDTK